MASTNQGGLFRALHDVRALKPTHVLHQITPQYILLHSILQRATREKKVLIVLFCTNECNLGTFDSCRAWSFFCIYF